MYSSLKTLYHKELMWPFFVLLFTQLYGLNHFYGGVGDFDDCAGDSMVSMGDFDESAGDFMVSMGDWWIGKI